MENLKLPLAVLYVVLCSEVTSAQCTLNAGNNLTLCQNAEQQLTATQTGNPTVVWFSQPPGGILSGDSTLTPTLNSSTAPQNYTLTAVGNNGQCSTSVVVSVLASPQAGLTSPGSQATFFNGDTTFYKCSNGIQTFSSFTFDNASVAPVGSTYTILWGDTGTVLTLNSFISLSHVYSRGIYNLKLIVTSPSGCTDTAAYKVFFGSNPAGGIVGPGNTSGCSPQTFVFNISGTQNNTPGTIYTVTFNDGTPAQIFNHPPPTSIPHTFIPGSCGTTSSNGIISFPNAFSANFVAENPCGVSAGSVVPIYISLPVVADFTVTPACVNNPVMFTDISLGEDIIPNGQNAVCNSNFPRVWSISPPLGWNITTGLLGSTGIYTGPNFDPYMWTSGSTTLGVSFTTPGTYTMQLIAANSCGPDTIEKTFCVQAPLSTSFVIDSNSVSGCGPLAVTLNNTTPGTDSSLPCGSITSHWNVMQGGSSCTQDSASDFTYINGTSAASINPQILFNNQGTYQLSLSLSNSCGTFISQTQTVVVKRKPHVTINNIPPFLCAGLAINPTANVQQCQGTNTQYSWSFPGGSPSAATTINPGTITYATTGTYTITLQVSNECGTSTATKTITVQNAPIAVAGADQSFCRVVNTSIGTSPVSGYNYSWSPSSGLSSSTVANPMVTLTANGSTVVSQTYTVTVSNQAGCTASDAVTVTIYPPAIISAGPSVSLCNVNSATLAGSVGGGATSVVWTSSNGGTFSDSTSTVSSYTPSLQNGSVILTISSNDPGGPCPAVSDTMTVTILPPPIANAGPDHTICGGSSIQIGSSPQSGYNYTWIPATGLSNAHAANPTLTLTNNSSSAVSHNYTLIVSATGCSDTDQVTITVDPSASVIANAPAGICAGDTILLNASISGAATSVTWLSADGTFSDTTSLNTVFYPFPQANNAVVTVTANTTTGSCPGTALSLPIAINAAPALNPVANQTICDGAPTQAVQLNSPVQGTNFSWSATATNGISGFMQSGNSGTIPSQVLHNGNSATGSVIYIVTPSKNGCVGAPTTFTVTVNPSPEILLPAPQVICNGDTNAEVIILSGTAGATFTWSSTASQGVTGNIPSGTGNIPSQTLYNNGSNNGTITYTITATATGCTATETYVMQVNSGAGTSFSIPSQTICSGNTSAQVDITTPAQGASISWVANVPAGITGAANSGTSAIPAQTLINSTSQALTITYMAQSNLGSGNCNGGGGTYSITVNPAVDLSIISADDTICSGTQTNIQLSSSTPGASFSWLANPSSGINGQSSGSGNLITQTLSNSDSVSGNVTYIVTVSAGSCPPKTDSLSIIVPPAPTLTNLIPAQTICTNSYSAPIQLSANINATTFEWTSTSTFVNGVLSTGTGDTIPPHLLTNTSPQADTGVVIYHITPYANGCAGNSADASIMVIAAPVADFVLSINSGCAPLLVSFATNSMVTGQPDSLVFNWGDGSANTILYPNPTQPVWNTVQHVFANYTIQALNYSISLTAANSCGLSTTSKTLVVPPSAVQAFFSPSATQGCEPLTVTFDDYSSGNTFANWCFDYDILSGLCNGPLTGTNPGTTIQHTFTAGDYVVALYVSDGCSQDTVFQTIHVNPSPIVDFNFLTDACGKEPVLFTAQSNPSPGSFLVSYYWQFGDGDSAAQNSSSHLYDTAGVYNVCLTVLESNGCSQSQCHPVTIGSHPTVNFSANNACVNTQPIQFTNNSVNSGYFQWNFGDGNTSVAQQPSHTFSNDGTYTITLIGASNGCSDTITHTIDIFPKPQAAFTVAAIGNNCGQPVSVNFTNSSTGGSGFNWNFGNGSNSTNVNPVATYVYPGTYTTSLVVSNQFNCSDTASQPVVINPAPSFQVNFTASNTCVNGAPIQFTNYSTGISFFQWIFGDGNTSVTQSPDHRYSVPGNYDVALIGSVNGCSDTVTKTVTVYPKPLAVFNMPSMYLCGEPATIAITNNSSGALGYVWNFGNGTFSTDVNPTVTYSSAGNYTVTLVAANQYGCSDTTAQPITVYPSPVINGIDISPSDGCQPFEITVNANATNGNQFTWDFGDGTSPVTFNSPTANYTYNDTGTYTIKLQVISYQTCGDTAILSDTVKVHIRAIADFGYLMNTTTEPINGTVIFTNQSQHADSYVWSFGDGLLSNEENPVHLFNAVNNFNVTLIAQNKWNCPDTIIKSLEIFKKSLYVPNAFSPDFGGGNDLVKVWQPIGIGLSTYHAQVFNTWGELLWESSELKDTKPAEAWNGVYHGSLCQQDVYVWKVEAVFLDGSRWEGMAYKQGERRKTIGSVTLIR